MTARYHADVPLGMEELAAEDVVERLGASGVATIPGGINFGADVAPADLLTLRGVERVHAWVGESVTVPSGPEGVDHLESVATGLDWTPAFDAWRRSFPDRSWPPTFRVTARRRGDHVFRSPAVGAAVGAAVVDQEGWTVDLFEHDLEVVVYIENDRATYGVCLCEGPLDRRNRIALGATTLRSSIAWAMIRQAAIRPGEVVLDPMCGVGTIPVEVVDLLPDTRVFASDVAVEAIERCAVNVAATPRPVPVFRADAGRMPFERGAIDVVITDMPFGRRMGSHRQNRRLYPRMMRDVERVLRIGGRAVLLSLERRLMRQTLETRRGLACRSELVIDMGGLPVSLFVLDRVEARQGKRAI